MRNNLSKIVQESVSKGLSSIKHTYYPSGMPENYLKPQQVEDIKTLLISSQISLLETELEKLKELEVSCIDDRLLGRTDEYLDGYNTSTERWREQRDSYVTYLTEQIAKIKKLI